LTSLTHKPVLRWNLQEREAETVQPSSDEMIGLSGKKLRNEYSSASFTIWNRFGSWQRLTGRHSYCSVCDNSQLGSSLNYHPNGSCTGFHRCNFLASCKSG